MPVRLRSICSSSDILKLAEKDSQQSNHNLPFSLGCVEDVEILQSKNSLWMV